jgi:phosphonate transport system substrate-binding protein
MTYVLSVSPDFMPDKIAGWFVFNTWLQRQTGEQFHLELYNGFSEQRKDILADRIDLIYANPYDASMLIREKGFMPLVRPVAKVDECTIAVKASNPIDDVESFSPGIRIATTADPDVHMMGMIMLEPAELGSQNTEQMIKENYVLVAKALMRDEADAGFFLSDAYNELSTMIRSELKVLISSRISVIHHAMMVGPRLAEQADRLKGILLDMKQDPKGPGVLRELGLDGWEDLTREDAEFMIDLMDTLVEK